MFVTLLKPAYNGKDKRKVSNYKPNRKFLLLLLLLFIIIIIIIIIIYFYYNFLL